MLLTRGAALAVRLQPPAFTPWHAHHFPTRTLKGACPAVCPRHGPPLPAGAASGAGGGRPYELHPAKFARVPYGSLAPRGWLLEQLKVQAEGVAGYLDVSTFPGADHVNTSLWVGGDGKAGGDPGPTDQWLPYWLNGMAPNTALLGAAAAEGAKVALASGVDARVPRVLEYILAHTNASGWLGPMLNEPGDKFGHGLWDPLNALKSIIYYGEFNPEAERRCAAAVVAHLLLARKLLETDKVQAWSATRWPTFVEVVHMAVDQYAPRYGDDPEVMPLGRDATVQALLEAAAMIESKGFNWRDYYHRNATGGMSGGKDFPTGAAPDWNVFDHGVNNAEGALKWPAVRYRRTGRDEDAAQEAYVLSMMDQYQGQPGALFAADEVFAGRQPERGTETCLVVEAMASLELAFANLGDPLLMDRVERLAFNAMPAALDAEMWTNVYVQQANSVFAGNSPAPSNRAEASRDGAASRPPRCSACGGGPLREAGDDAPSGEDLNANFFGVGHFPCCLTNFPQGWPKFAQHAFMTGANESEVIVASLVPAKASLDAGDFTTDSDYPFGDTATITAKATKDIMMYVRVPGWADKATVDGLPAMAGSFVGVECLAGKRRVIKVALNPEVKVEYGWGAPGSNVTVVPYDADGAEVPAADPKADWVASFAGSHLPGYTDIRSGDPGNHETAVLAHPLRGAGHYLTGASVSFRYAAGYTPKAGEPAKNGTTATLVVLDFETRAELAGSEPSPPLDKFSFDTFTRYSDPVVLTLPAGTRVPNAKLLALAIRFEDNERNVQVPVGAGDQGLRANVTWSGDVGPEPVPPAGDWTEPPVNGAVVTRGPLVFSLRPESTTRVFKNYSDYAPVRPKAVDYEINATGTWDYALVLGGGGKAPQFVRESSAGWAQELPWSRQERPFYIRARARRVASWGRYGKSQVLAPPPSSPVDCGAQDAGCGDEVDIELVPYGATAVRVTTFPWTHPAQLQRGVSSAHPRRLGGAAAAA